MHSSRNVSWTDSISRASCCLEPSSVYTPLSQPCTLRLLPLRIESKIVEKKDFVGPFFSGGVRGIPSILVFFCLRVSSRFFSFPPGSIPTSKKFFFQRECPRVFISLRRPERVGVISRWQILGMSWLLCAFLLLFFSHSRKRACHWEPVATTSPRRRRRHSVPVVCVVGNSNRQRNTWTDFGDDSCPDSSSFLFFPLSPPDTK